MMRPKILWSYSLALLIIGIPFYFFTSKHANTPPASDVLGETTIAPTEEIIPTSTLFPTNSPTPIVTVSATEIPAPTTSRSSSLPSITVIPTPTSEPVMQYVMATPEPPKVISEKAGSVTTLVFSNLSANSLYKIDLSAYNADSFVLKWAKEADIDWSSKQGAILKSELTDIPIDDDTLTDNVVQYSGLLEIPNGKFIYLYPKSSVEKVTLSLIDPTDTVGSLSIQSSTGIYNSNSGASYTSLPIVTRDQWGANPSSWDKNSSADIDSPSRFVWSPVYYKVSRIVIHHTVTSDSSNPAATVRAIYLSHAYARDNTGWGDIGYNYLIDQNGVIYEGKAGGDETQGYHAFGSANRMSIGISMIGNFTNSQPTPKARAALTKLLAEKAAFYGFNLKYSDGAWAKWKDPSYTVFGHRGAFRWNYDLNKWDPVPATACPGEAFVPILPSLVKEAEVYRSSHFGELKTLVKELNASFAQPHQLGVIVVKYKVAGNTPESVMKTYVPAYSGISSYTIVGNTITYKIESKIIDHPWCTPNCKPDETEYVVPPMNWYGYDEDRPEYAASIIPGVPLLVMNGPDDRSKTLLKIFRLDPRVEAADLHNSMSIQ